jgi:hypothetical protein
MVELVCYDYDEKWVELQFAEGGHIVIITINDRSELMPLWEKVEAGENAEMMINHLLLKYEAVSGNIVIMLQKQGHNYLAMGSNYNEGLWKQLHLLCVKQE